jgi:hypothetical protein
VVKATPVKASTSESKGKTAVVRAAAAESPTSRSKGKDKDILNIISAPKCLPPSPVNKPIHYAYVEIHTSSKRKVIAVQVESSKSEEEDDYLASRVFVFNAFV